ncbi:Uncharacterised protein [Bordetella pertussis]|nr:Uncharacterised protein [Bordetella pertussis]
MAWMCWVRVPMSRNRGSAASRPGWPMSSKNAFQCLSA